MRYKIPLSIIFSVLIVFAMISCNNSSEKSSKIDQSNHKVSNDSILLDSISRLINKFPYNANYYEQRSGVYEKLGKLTASMNDLEKALELDSLNVNFMVRLSDKYLQFGQSQITRELLFKAIKLEPENVEVLYRLGSLYFYVQDYKQSVNYLKQAKKVDPFYAPTYFTYGMIYKEKGDTLNAIEQFQIAVEREPNYYDAYILLGSLCTGLGDSIAVDYYDNALEILPGSYEASYGIAMFYQINDKPERAINQYQFMLKGNRDKFQHVFFNLGYIEMLYYNEFETAIAYFDSAIAIQPDYVAAYSNKGYCFEQLSNQQNAKQCYIKALEYDPSFKVAKLGLRRLSN